MSKILANQIANYGDDSPIEVKEGLNIPAGKPLQAAGAPGSNGQILSSTGSTVQWIDNFSGSYNDLTNLPTIPAAQVNSDWNAVGTVAEILNKPIIPPQSSVTVNPVGTANLEYNASNGQFTYTPPDFSGYATTASIANSGNWDTAYGWGDHAAAGYLTSYTETDPVFSVHPSAGITNAQITNWDTAYNWGDHASAGYLTNLDIEDLDNVDISGGLSDQQVLKWNAANSAWEPANDLVGGAQGVALTDLSVSTTAAGTAALSYNNTNGVFTYTPPDLSGYLTSYTETDPVFTASPANGITLTDINQWNTAYSWGNHANGGYLVATAQDKTNWNTAFGWGDHGAAGYLTAEADTLLSVTNRGNTTNQFISFSSEKGISMDTASNNPFEIYGSSNQKAYIVHAQNNGAGGAGDLVVVAKNGLHVYGGTSEIAANLGFEVVSGYSKLLYQGNTKLETTSTGVTVTGALTAGGLTYPTSNGTNGQVLTSDGSGNVVWAAGGSGGANVTISDTAPGSPSAGDLWWESDKGRLKIYYNDTDSTQWVDASPPLAQPNVPVAVGNINMNANSPTWSGTAGYTVAKSGGDGTAGGGDVFYTLTFPTAYTARTDYIVQASYDGTDFIPANGAQIGIERNTGNIVFCVRRWNEDPLNLGDIMVTITNL